MAPTGSEVWRDFVSNGIPSSGKHKPSKKDIRAWSTYLESLLGAVIAAGGKLYTSLAAMNADLTPEAHTPALVIGDPTVGNNGLYVKVGPAGAGSWSRVGDIPGFQFVRAENVGAGTPNAIVATSALPISNGVLVYLPIDETNTATPVTVSFNGTAAFTIKTASGNDPVTGGLVAGMVALGVVSGSFFRLVSDQASAAIVATAEAAAERAEEAADLAQAVAAGIDLPPVAPNRMLIDNAAGTARESKTFDEVRMALGVLTSSEVELEISSFRILAGTDPTGVTNNDALFSAIRIARPNEIIDLRGGSYSVTTPPAGDWVNGFWKIGNFFHPVQSIIDREIMLTNGNIVRNWPQDTAHNHRGIRYCDIGAGLSHGSVDNNVRQLASRNGGFSCEETVEFEVPDASHSVWCASKGVHSNRQFAIVRTADVSLIPTAVRMYHRKLYAQYKIANAFTTTAGSNVVTITFPELHGLRTGDQIYIIASGNPNGATIANGLYSVTRVNSPGTTVTIVASTVASTSGVSGLADGTTIHTPATSWTEMLFGGVQFGAAVATASGAGLPVTTQSFGPFAVDRAMVCVSGGPYGLVRISGLFGTTPAIQYTPLTNAGLTEPTLCVSSVQTAGGRCYGLTRANGPATNIGFFYANTLTGTPVVVLENNFAFKFGRQNPSPIRIHEPTDTLYAVTSERMSSTQANSKLPIYLMVAKRSEAEVLGAAAFKVLEIGKLRAVPSGYSGSGLTYTTSNSGVPSIDVDGDTLVAYFAQEESQSSADAIGSSGRSNIIAFEIDISRPIVR